MLQESKCSTVNVPEQETIKSVSVPQSAITPISLYVPPLGLFQSIAGDPSHVMLVGVSPLLQVKTGGVIGLVAYPELGNMPHIRLSASAGSSDEQENVNTIASMMLAVSEMILSLFMGSLLLVKKI
jgi:hypothetical protein